jgi:hypothetical protein
MPSKKEIQDATLGGPNKKPYVVGLKDVAGTNTPIVPRLDIDVFWNQHPKAFNIFVQALAVLQTEGTSAPMGYFQIAGMYS